MFRRRAPWIGVLLTAAATAVALVVTVGAQAGRDKGGETLVLRSAGPVSLQQVSADCFGFVGDLQSPDGRRIGRVTSCIDNFGDGAVGGFFSKGRFFLELHGGVLTADLESRLSTGMDPFATGPLALPDGVAANGDQLFGIVTEGSVTGGTNRFAHATGTVIGAGFGVDDSELNLKWVDNVFVIQLGH